MPIFSCRICNNTKNNRSYIVQEKMYGLLDEFEYIQCAICGCLQIKEVPNNLARFYPTDYYSYSQTGLFEPSTLRKYIKKERAKYFFSKKGFIGKIILKATGVPERYGWLEKAGVNFNSSILDVGCGAGHLLLNLKTDGFNNLTGVDPFIEKSINYQNGIIIHKKDIAEIKQSFDFIMLHHSFEHMVQPLSILKQVFRILKKDRFVLIRIPVASSWAFATYQENWVQLDAPRHLFLHTLDSMKILASQAGFQIKDVIYDSTAFQFWGSEQYKRGIFLRALNSYAINPSQSIFSKEKISQFESRTAELNQQEKGDMACFYLYKK